MTNSWILKTGVSFAALVCAHAAFAGELPAVSGLNGKIELGGGALSSPSTGVGYVAGTLSVPAGDRFGVQFDASIHNSVNVTGGGALHVFTRDPSSFLFGAAGTVLRSNVGTLGAIGVEAEFYYDQFSLEAYAGLAGIDYDAAAAVDKSGMFAIVDAAFYPNDDLRLEIGGSSILGYESLHIGLEYQVSGFETPFSVTGDVRIGETGAVRAVAGLKLYFGGAGKSLSERHRLDDPDNRSLDLFGTAGDQLTSDGAPTCDNDPETALPPCFG